MSEYDWNSPEVFAVSEPMSDDISRAKIIMAGKKAQREINGAQLDAQRAWEAWRMYEATFDKDTGSVNSKIAAAFEWSHKPSIRNPDGSVEAGVRFQKLTGEEHPEHKRLREIAEAADRKVLDMRDAMEIYTALAPQIANMGRRSK